MDWGSPARSWVVAVRRGGLVGLAGLAGGRACALEGELMVKPLAVLVWGALVVVLVGALRKALVVALVVIQVREALVVVPPGALGAPCPPR